MTLEMPFKDHADLPDPAQGWSPERSAGLARDCLGALWEWCEGGGGRLSASASGALHRLAPRRHPKVPIRHPSEGWGLSKPRDDPDCERSQLPLG